MTSQRVGFFRTHARTIAALFFGFAFSLTVVYATPPTSPYNPGETLDPTCLPTDTNCTVTIFPDQTTHAGQFLQTDGTHVAWHAVAASGLALQTNGTPNGSQSLLNLVAGSNVTLTDNGTGSVTVASATPPVYTASNGLTKTTNDIALGGTLIKTTTINTTNFPLKLLSNNASDYAQYINATGLGLSISANQGDGIDVTTSTGLAAVSASNPDGYGVFGESSTQFGVYGVATDSGDGVFGVANSGNGVWGQSTSGTAIVAISATGTALTASSQKSDGTPIATIQASNPTGFDNAPYTILSLSHRSTSPANGIGTILDFSNYTASAGPTTKTSNQLISSWINATDASRTSQFSITGVNSAITSTLFTILGSGAVKLNHYGSGTFTGTATHNLAVDASGNIIEVATGGGGNTIYTADDHLTSNRIVYLDHNLIFKDAGFNLGFALYPSSFAADLQGTSGSDSFDALFEPNSINLVTYSASGMGSILINNAITLSANDASDISLATSSGGNINFQNDGSIFIEKLLNNNSADKIVVWDNSTGQLAYKDVSSFGGGGGGPTLQTNGTPNGSQSLLNLVAGSNVTLTDNGTGSVTIDAASLLGSTSTLNSETWLGTSPVALGTAATNGTVFIGPGAGTNATNAVTSNFIGVSAGSGATNAANSIFIGTGAGQFDTVDNTSGGESILIGNNTSTGGFSNSIALGASATNTATNQLLIAPAYTQLNVRGINYTWPSAQALGSGYVLSNNGSGTLSWAAPSAGTTYTASNGLTLTGSNFTLGGTLTGNTALATGSANSLIISSTGANDGLSATNSSSGSAISATSSSSGTAIKVSNTSNGNGISINNSSSAAGLIINTNSGTAIQAFSTSGVPGYFIGNGTNNSVSTVLKIDKGVAGAGANGIGVSIDLSSTTSTGLNQISNSVISKLTDATFATRTSEFSITGINSAVTNTLFTLAGSGAARLNQYGSGTFTGTATKTLQVDSSGNVIEGAVLVSSPITIGTSGNTLYSSGLSGAGQGDTIVGNNIFLGLNAGSSATGASYSNFFGNGAGSGATSAAASNFFGNNAGLNASSSYFSNFIGADAGSGATNANDSNFIGSSAGASATNAAGSNFFGVLTGSGATNATESNFLGDGAGQDAVNASYSNLMGWRVAEENTSGIHIGSNNIIIGTNITLPDTTANAINFGGVLFGTGSYATTTGDPSFTPQTAGKIGIATIPTQYTLEVGNSSITGIVASFTNSTGSCTINPTTSSVGCSSDENLKKNITILNNQNNTDVPFVLNTNIDIHGNSILDDVLALTPVQYNWKTESDSDPKHTGFIAQEVREVFPDLVAQDPDTGLLSVNYMGFAPYTVEAIKELDVKVESINNLTNGTDDAPNFVDNLRAWFANAGNHITRIFTGEICLTDPDGSSECLNKTELGQLKQLLVTPPSSAPTQESNPTDDTTTPPTDDTPPADTPNDTPALNPNDPAVDTGPAKAPDPTPTPTTPSDTTTTTTTSDSTPAPIVTPPAPSTPAPTPSTDTAPTTPTPSPASDTPATTSQ